MAKAKNDAPQTYGNESISKLKGADRVRKRPAVIFGSDGLEGCEHSIFEIISNSIDEAREGYGNKIVVTKFLDKSIEVQDFGRGIPVDYNKKLDFEGIYNTEEPVEEFPQVLVKAYLDHDDSVLLVINDEHDEIGDLRCYSHIGQHSSCDPYYPDELEELSPKDPRVKELVEEYKNNFNKK